MSGHGRRRKTGPPSRPTAAETTGAYAASPQYPPEEGYGVIDGPTNGYQTAAPAPDGYEYSTGGYPVGGHAPRAAPEYPQAPHYPQAPQQPAGEYGPHPLDGVPTGGYPPAGRRTGEYPTGGFASANVPDVDSTGEHRRISTGEFPLGWGSPLPDGPSGEESAPEPPPRPDGTAAWPDEAFAPGAAPAARPAPAGERPLPPLRPVEVSEVLLACLGTIVWIALLVLSLVYHQHLSRQGRGWWTYTCVAGIGIGLLGIYFTRRRREAWERKQAPGDNREASGRMP